MHSLTCFTSGALHRLTILMPSENAAIKDEWAGARWLTRPVMPSPAHKRRLAHTIPSTIPPSFPDQTIPERLLWNLIKVFYEMHTPSKARARVGFEQEVSSLLFAREDNLRQVAVYPKSLVLDLRSPERTAAGPIYPTCSQTCSIWNIEK